MDIETSGPVPGIHSLLSIGVTHVRRIGGEYKLFDDLYLELQPTHAGVHEAAMAIHKLALDQLAKTGLPPKEAMEKLYAWVRDKQKDVRDRPVFVAHNAPFDWMFCAYTFGHTGVPNPFGHSAIDTKALAMGKLDLPWTQTSLKTVASKLPSVPPRDESTLHHAGADARYQAVVFAALMNLKREKKGEA